jgi:hypothetical protein
MGERDKNKTVPQEDDLKPEKEKQERKPMSDKLRKKLEKLKKDDPNIYPVF